MNKLTKILAAFLVLLAACLAALAWWMGRQTAIDPPVVMTEPAPAHSVVIAAVPLEQGKRIDAKDLKVIDSPRPIPGSYQSINHVAGRIAAGNIGADTLLTEGNLVQGIALQLADGERAVALPVDEVIGVGHKLDPGDYVDVFVTLKQGNTIEKAHARLLASRLRVLAYGTDVIGAIDKTGSEVIRKPQGQSAQQARTAVLAAPVEEVNSLLLAVQNGKLALALRHPGDTGIADNALFPASSLALVPRAGLSAQERQALEAPNNRAFAGIDMKSWSGGEPARATRTSAPRAATPAQARQPQRTLEVIKGTQREQVRF